jgi:predicted Zn-dependent protease
MPGRKRPRDPWIDAAHARVWSFLERDELHRAREALQGAREAHPGAICLEELAADLAYREDRIADALEHILKVLEVEPHRPLTLVLMLQALHRCERFVDCGEAARDILQQRRGIIPPLAAAAHYHLALALDRAGQRQQAEEHFRQAVDLEPKAYFVPCRLDAERFNALLREAMDSTPTAVRPYLEGATVDVRDYPTHEEIDPFALSAGFDEDDGPASRESRLLRCRLEIYQRNIEILCRDADELREECRRSVLGALGELFDLTGGPTE